jgi:hypothetical protein
MKGKIRSYVSGKWQARYFTQFLSALATTRSFLPARRKIPKIERLENAFTDIDRLMAERQSECPFH